MASPPPTESGPKDGENDGEKPAMDKFKDLAKGVFGVSRASYEVEEQRFREAQARRNPTRPK